MRLLLILVFLVFPSLAFAAPPYAVFPPCPTGTPLPTECLCQINGGIVAKFTPHIAPSDKKVYCYCEMGGTTGQPSLTGTPVNTFGAADATTVTLDMTQAGAPAKLGVDVKLMPQLPQ